MLITTTIAFTILIIIAISWRYRYESALPVLKYHRVNTTTNDDITIHTDFFEQQLAYLAENGYRTIFMDEVYNYLYKSRHIPKKTIALTFDDGFLDNWVYAFPLLQKYNIKATIFLTTDYISNSVVLRKNTKTSKTPGDLPISHLSHDGFKSAFQGNPDNYLSWHEIKTMQSSGLVDFQSHTESHRHVFANNEPIEILRDADINNISYKLYSALEGRIDTITPIFKTGASIVTRAFHHGPAEYFESKSEYLHRLDKEIRNAKDIIETELDKTCKYLAWPWGEYNKYAIAKSLSLKYNTKLKMDLSWFSSIPKTDTARNLKLEYFNVNTIEYFWFVLLK